MCDTAMKTTSRIPTVPRVDMEKKYRTLFNEELPAVAKAQKWPIYLNHCLMRVVLDNYCGKCWYEHWDQKKGALKSMTDN